MPCWLPLGTLLFTEEFSSKPEVERILLLKKKAAFHPLTSFGDKKKCSSEEKVCAKGLGASEPQRGSSTARVDGDTKQGNSYQTLAEETSTQENNGGGGGF